MGCSNSKEYNKDELDVQNRRFIFEQDATSNNNKYNNAEELEKLIISYIKNKESSQLNLSRMECDEFINSVRLLLTRIQQDYLQETKLDSQINNNDKKVIIAINLIRRHSTNIYYQLENDINRTIALLNEREIYSDELTDDDLSSTIKTPSASSHKQSKTDDNKIEISPTPPPPPPPLPSTPPQQVRKKIDEIPKEKNEIPTRSSHARKTNNTPPITPTRHIEPKKAYVVDQSKRPDIKPKPFMRLIEDDSFESRLSALSDSSDDYGFIELSEHDTAIPVNLSERTCWIR